jgi:hypothetical protein
MHAAGAESQTSGVVARHASATFGNELDQLSFTAI